MRLNTLLNIIHQRLKTRNKMTEQKCKNPDCNEPANGSYCQTCVTKALDKAFTHLQLSLSIDPKTGKHNEQISKGTIRRAKNKLLGLI